ncbi:MAG: cobalamin biosynthesis protein CobQ [Thermoproteota archaeon]|nr:MAG: cobalamin biosynthesis protein CobQ [Candidatus Korarchaeota archaeon]
MPRVAVTGGKGGTGKTTVAANTAYTLAQMGLRVLLIDADVDAPSSSRFLGVSTARVLDVMSFLPAVDPEKCTMCGLCAQACRPHALVHVEGRLPMLFPELCSGCEACKLVCPSNAITDSQKLLGWVNKAEAHGITLVEGELQPTEARSTLVLLKAMEYARSLKSERSYDMTIVDTAPGTHCNVIHAIRGADLALAVTEPTPLGVHDLELILKLTQKLQVRTAVVLNRADLPGGTPEEVERIASRHHTPIVAEIPLDPLVQSSHIQGKPVLELAPSSRAAEAFRTLAKAVLELASAGAFLA